MLAARTSFVFYGEKNDLSEVYTVLLCDGRVEVSTTARIQPQKAQETHCYLLA